MSKAGSAASRIPRTAIVTNAASPPPKREYGRHASRTRLPPPVSGRSWVSFLRSGLWGHLLSASRQHRRISAQAGARSNAPAMRGITRHPRCRAITRRTGGRTGQRRPPNWKSGVKNLQPDSSLDKPFQQFGHRGKPRSSQATAASLIPAPLRTTTIPCFRFPCSNFPSLYRERLVKFLVHTGADLHIAKQRVRQDEKVLGSGRTRRRQFGLRVAHFRVSKARVPVAYRAKNR